MYFVSQIACKLMYSPIDCIPSGPFTLPNTLEILSFRFCLLRLECEDVYHVWVTTLQSSHRLQHIYLSFAWDLFSVELTQESPALQDLDSTIVSRTESLEWDLYCTEDTAEFRGECCTWLENEAFPKVIDQFFPDGDWSDSVVGLNS